MGILLYPLVLLLRLKKILPVILAATLVGCHRAPLLWLSPTLSIEPAAFHFADSLYHAGWVQRTEKAACVTGYSIRPDGTVVVRRLEPGVVLRSDSIMVEYRCPLATNPGLHDMNVPTLHTHLVENGGRYFPSWVDSAWAKKATAPFHLMMSDSHVWTVLWRPKDTHRLP